MRKFLNSLTEPQLRALAYQSLVKGWNYMPARDLYDLLLINKRAQKIYRENYGKEASI